MGNLDSAGTLAQLSAPSVYESDSDDIIGRRLPFGSLDRHQLRRVLCLPVELGSPDFEQRQRECRSTPKGNYMASAVLADLRITHTTLNTRRPRSLEAVLDLPHELVLEIFGYLHPIDLYHITCATKYLRGFLLDRRSAFVWEKAFLEYPNVPDCPKDVSFPKWASLLFGPATCDKCGYPNVLVDFTYRKRLCQICMRAKDKSRDSLTLLVHQVLCDYPEAQDDVWALLRYTYRTSSYLYRPYDYQVLPHYWVEDVRERAEEMKVFLLAIESGDVNAEEEYETFKSKTAAATLGYNKHAIMCNRWAAHRFYSLDADFKVLLVKFQDICFRRLLALGYDQRDVSNIPHLPQYLYANCKQTTPSRFARKDYRQHLPSLEMMVLMAKNERLAAEYAQRVEARREEVAAFYHDTTAYINPAHWQHLPRVCHIQQLAPFTDYIRKDPDPLGEQCVPVDTWRSAVLSFVDKWIKARQAHLREVLEEALPTATQVSQYETTDILNLATAVFLCHRCDPLPCVLIGWDAVGPHLLCAENQVDANPTYEKNFQFFEEGYHTIIQLLGLLNLNLLATTVKDLDELNARFICNTSKSVMTVSVLTWRECVNHVFKVWHAILHNPPRLTFSLLTEEATQSVLFHETVTSHLKLIHGTPRPVENVDFFYLQPKTPPERKCFFITHREGYSQRCVKCKHPSNLRIWGHGALLLHLNDKHKISEPVEGADFTVISIRKKRKKSEH